jgi:hypothetical protein
VHHKEKAGEPSTNYLAKQNNNNKKRDLSTNYLPPPELLRTDRKRLIDGPILREMLFKFKHWDEVCVSE